MDRLDILFAAARRAEPDPSPDLMARIIEDALKVQADSASPGKVTHRRGWTAHLRDAIGGWPAISTLAAASVAGVWIGASPPQTIDMITASLRDSPAQTLWIDVEPVLEMGLGEDLM
jgi:hypothetical protein